MKFSRHLVLTLLFIGMSSYSFAQLNVIADLGGESAVRFYEPIQPVHSDTAPQHPNAVPSQLTEEQLLPIVSHKWSVGKVDAIPLNLPGAWPLFLVGADEVSERWLQSHYEHLRAIGATGLVINVNNEQELRQLRTLVPELNLLPVPADSLAERLGIFHYPLLITAEGISQ